MLFIHTIYVPVLVCYFAGCELKDVVRGAKIPWNPDTQTITVTTNSAVGSNEFVYMAFYHNDGHYTGGVSIYFSTPIQYSILWCTPYSNFPDTVPAEAQKIWTITYNTKGRSVIIHCNGIQVANVLLSDSVCGYKGSSWKWEDYWEMETTLIQMYDDYDTASDKYCVSDYAGKYNGGF